MNNIYKIYAYLFGSPRLYKMNRLLYHLSLRGMGILNYESDYLSGEMRWLKKYLAGRPAPVVIDVGANIGKYAIAIRQYNSNSKIYAFEPHPLTFKSLETNLNLKGKKGLKCYNMALGEKDGLLELFDYMDGTGSEHASLFKGVISDLHQGETTSFKVEVKSLDNFLLGESILDIDLLKIDTEGNEYNVLLGAANYLKERKIKAIHIEFNEMNIISEVTFKKFWDLLSAYKIYRILPGGKLLKINKYSPVLCEIYAYQNLIAILS